MTARPMWRRTVVLALGVIAVMLGFGMIDGMKACGGGDPIFAFEMVGSPADVEALFPGDCRAVHAAAQREGLWLDIALFVWVYSAFLICGLLALKREAGDSASRTASIAIGLVCVAAIADQFENLQLLRILDSMPGTQETINALYPAPRIKFAALGLVTALAGLLHLRGPGWRKLAGGAALGFGLWSAVGVFANHAWVLKGMTFGWIALTVAALILSFAKGSVPVSGDGGR